MMRQRSHLIAGAAEFLVVWLMAASWQEQVCRLEFASANCESPAHQWSADAEVLAAASSAPGVLQWRQQQDADLEAVSLDGVVELSGDTTLPRHPTALPTSHAGPSSH